MDSRKSETRAVAAVVLIVCVLTAAYTGLYLWIVAQFDVLAPLRVLLILTGIANIALCLVVFRQRIREIQKGEEDDLSKY